METAEIIGKLPGFPAFEREESYPRQLDGAVARFATERTMNPEPIDPETALELYLTNRI